MMKYAKLLVIIITVVLSGLFCFQNILNTQNVGDVVKVSGVINIGAAYAVFFVGLSSLSGALALTFNLPFPILREKVLLFIILVIAPALTYITYQEIQSNIKGYFECQNASETTLRYSSRTYAVSSSLCEQQPQ
ncbi:hypothetical protein AAFX19_26780 [Vibrio harveyi]|jgi:amino acid transporter|uniref:hypothetical protein n=1 Tax=Vibrio harveyi TaxID=669 RepID=UPI0023EDD126|nr:hypothetical protein [Vibrio parahaemolyticus]MDG2607733.1 hypothetical protein [Vibrio parahaemolyticus]HCE3469722.1 hypothetical protein [Vibrio parahaemolyticus]HCG9177395.1 hypothetical protein [Vibrio parahaemolyticus]HCG9887509.1 hypothetical protein [Vibrio parahaemolyticus]